LFIFLTIFIIFPLFFRIFSIIFSLFYYFFIYFPPFSPLSCLGPTNTLIKPNPSLSDFFSLLLSLMYEPIRGGTRGGAAEFKWTDVSADKDREVLFTLYYIYCCI